MNGHGHGHGRGNEREGGFTLMEILLAMTILMIGLLPMLAVFKTALNNLNRAIEDTYASSIAQSVMDAIRLGLKDMKVEQSTGGVTWKYFIFDHDGLIHKTVGMFQDVVNGRTIEIALGVDDRNAKRYQTNNQSQR